MSPQAAWILQEEVVPRLKTTIPRTVNQIGSEDAEELVQDSICFAARLLDNAERANKKVTPGNISFFTSLHMRSGRRATHSTFEQYCQEKWGITARHANRLMLADAVGTTSNQTNWFDWCRQPSRKTKARPDPSSH